MRGGELQGGQELQEFQIKCANTGDLCVVVPTGLEKLKIWILPLLAQDKAISLVIVSFTSLGFQSKECHAGTSICCTFLHSDGQTKKNLSDIANSGNKQVVYACMEILETPAVACVLRLESFKSQLSAIYLDKAHMPPQKPLMVSRLYPASRTL
ncbi:hypothetical protein B0H34DRAFT_797942 [Crassisporium funariophilum]|nr:hypothetical protein B0H34DRAFT_797942 [Crassisporium funariophilum]